MVANKEDGMGSGTPSVLVLFAILDLNDNGCLSSETI
jgi:hypothetical protein